MSTTLRNFFDALKGSDAGTKVVIAVASAAMIGTVAVVGMMAKDEHYVPAFVDVPGSDMPAVTKALADAGIQLEVRTSDRGSAIYVPRGQKDAANFAAFSSGAFRSHEKGILNGDSSSLSVFAGSDERAQWTRAKEMEEIEAMLESTSYIEKAEGYKRQVVTSALRNTTSETASLMVTTTGGMELTNGQKQAVSRAFGDSLGLTADEYSIYDQDGRTIHGGSDDGGVFDDRVLELQREYNQSEELRVNSYLARIYGPGKALVSIASEFDTTQSTLVSREAGDPVTISSKDYSTETPAGTSSSPYGGGVAGTSANVIDPNAFGVESAAVATGPQGPSPGTATSSETEETFFVPTTSRTEVSNQPVLKRLAVALAIDESLAAERAELDDLVKGLVGYTSDGVRKDTFTSKVAPFVTSPEPAEGEGAPEQTPASGGFDLNMILERGVEILTALAFIVLLLKGLKGAKGAAAGGPLGGDGEPLPAGATADAEIDPEVLARAQVENLVSNNPERVAQILSNWVIEDRSAVKS